MQQSEQKERLTLLKQEINNINLFNVRQFSSPPTPTPLASSSAPSWTKDKKVLYSANNKSTTTTTTTATITTTTKTTSATVGADSKPKKVDPPDQATSSNNDTSNSLFKSQNEPRHRQTRREEPNNGTSSKIEPDSSNNSQQQQQQMTANNNNNQTNTSSSSANTIIGHYQLKRTLGKGNFSTVKLAQHRITQHSVAIKVVKISILSEDNLMKINREIEVLKKLGQHDHIVRLYQVIKTKRYFMLVTEYCPNGELYDYLVDKGKLSEIQSCNYFLQILSAVEYLHEHNVVHRDLKAENLLLTEENKTIKIADFGFANYYKNDKPLSTWCGSPPYAAPELFKGLQYVGPPVDIWSMGVILYVMVCGSLPFDGHNLVYLKSRVLSGKYRIPFFMSTECEGLIKGMLRLDPERRFNIRQIKANSWILKYSELSAKSTDSSTATGNVSQNVPAADDAPSKSNKGDTFKTSVASNDDSASIKNLDKNNNSFTSSRYKSLEQNDDKKKAAATVSYSNEDSPMPCSSGENSTCKMSHKDTSGVKAATSKIHNFVDTEIVNAVSNMSLDSNNSAMSVSQSYNTLSNSNNGGISNGRLFESSRPETRNGLSRRISLNKENSIDDQIIDYMVENLKVADSQSSIRQSIANDRYDDLHAMYRLIKDQPRPHFEAHKSAKFKIPSLPLISLNEQQSNKKPSITTGFFNAPATTSFPDTAQQNNNQPLNSAATACLPVRPKNFPEDSCNNYNGGPIRRQKDDRTPMETLQNDAMNLTNVRQQSSKPTSQADDQIWQVPPQLFLTPPTENRNRDSEEQASRKSSDVEPQKTNADVVFSSSSTNSDSFNNTDSNSGASRQSFDSTLQQLCDISGAILASSSNNKLTLSNTAKHCLWDSSILDNLGVSSPPQHGGATYNQFTGNHEQNSPNSNMSNHQGESLQLTQNIAGITTNLPQIGFQQSNVAYQNVINQNLYLAQLNSLALSAAVTQSSMLAQGNLGDQKYQAATPIKFTPNNLMNQNFTVMNNLGLQNTINNPCIPNLSLLDPNGLISGFERRASDGQASYSSLTTAGTTEGNPAVSNIDGRKYESARLNSNSTFQAAPSSAAANAFLSSSSNQISSDSSKFVQIPNFCSFDATNTNTRSQACRQNDEHSLTSEESMIVSTDEIQQKETSSQQQLKASTQIDPLDLTKCSNDIGQAINQSAFVHQRQQQQQLGKTTGQRSNSTASASLIFHHLPMSATTSPRSSFFISGAANNNSQNHSYQASPSSLSLTAGGPGHLLNSRRKRHSLETESRHHHHHHHHYQRHANNQQPGNHHLHYGPNLHLLKNYNDSNRSLRQSNNQQQYLQYPMNSHIGQLRNFAQTFTYGKSTKESREESPSTIWPDTTPAQQSTNCNVVPEAADLANSNFVRLQDYSDEKSRT